MSQTAPARSAPAAASARPGISRGMTVLLATATGAIAANMYYAQPLLDVIARSVGISAGAAGVLVTVTQLGFALGLVFVLPLADIVRRRSLLTVLLMLDAAALAAVGAAPCPTVALVAFAALGLANVAAQVLVPAAAHLADDAHRGRTVATVISGLLTGMLLARTVAGIATELVGWRPLFLGAAALMVTLAMVLRRALHGMDALPGRRLGYGEVLRSTVRIYRTHAAVRVRAAYGALGFGAFSVFWSTAALRLSRTPFDYPPAVIGLFGLLGAAGAIAANLTGRVRRHTHPLPTAFAVALIAVAFAVLLPAGDTLGGMIAGVLILDIGVQGLHVLNQRVIYDVDAEARNRVNSIYMTFDFVGGALGSAVASLMWAQAGWPGVCLTGLGITALASLLWICTSYRAGQAGAPVR
ncbi:MFS transporter [Streptomyces sp. NBC_00557]|uniref:MFS transporter n=1 Tax=Streptomyces sp. NBC_00557 TaxID=2975776 RepID=UPI002E814F41|nr:MFS transporter [Streptomyces sp. NBC_00557]WUC39201.1 MFS transporter [Streptomyces sp. NBC_00557]